MEQPEVQAVKTERRGGLLSRLPFRPGERPPQSFDSLARAVKARNARIDLKELQRAYAYAETAHEGQKRLSGEDFIEHPLSVAIIVADLGMDQPTLMAALLHDVVEDTPLTLGDIEREFGPQVAAIVDGLTKLDKIKFRSREQEQAENTRKMIIAMAQDIRVLLIKLADRLHNMRTLEVFSRQKQHEKATETLEIYGPLAHRLGVHRIKWELEDLSFKALHPHRFEEIQRLVEKRDGERQEYLDRVLDISRSKLREMKIKADVQGRPKHLYSVYEKMVLRGKEFNEIYDLVGIRVLVDSLRDCYAALGALHAQWKPVPGRFKDYIAMPKFNMYQSLHTTVIGPEGRPLEVQIRTRGMHQTAEYGIAAHWRYKEGSKKDKDEQAELQWLGRMLEWQRDMSDPREFMEGLKVDLYAGRVFVFSPKGDVFDLPAGSVPLDFAYAVHTEVGHRCVGARVNGRLVPLDYELQIGDVVEVLTSKAQDAAPKRDWLNLVKSPRARNKIRQWFSRERREDALETGRDLLQRELRRHSLPVVRLSSDHLMSQVAADLKYPTLDALYVAIGEGQVSPQSIVSRLARLVSEESEEAEEIPAARPVRLGSLEAKGASAVVVQGRSDVWVRLAMCCTPVPGDEIVGFVTRGAGVSVHRADCPNVKELTRQPDRMIEVDWASGKATSFVVSVQIEALDRQKLLRDVANVLGDQRVNIISASTNTGRDRVATLRFIFELADIAHLSSILSAVKKVEGVYDARRVVPH